MMPSMNMLSECGAAHTPMMQQYWAIKSQYPQHLLFYQMGDFYELFYEDAQTASERLGITLTYRGHSAGQPVPMAGVPIHAASEYWSKLLAEGLSLVICDQNTEPRGKGLVERNISRILTPGTIVDEGLVDESSDHLLLAVRIEGPRNVWGLCAIDLTRAHILVAQGEGDHELAAAFSQLRPSEVLFTNPSPLPGLLPLPFCKTPRPLEQFNTEQGRLLLKNLRCEGFDPSVLSELTLQAFAAAYAYLTETQRRQIPHLKRCALLNPCDFIQMGAHVHKHLELLENLQGGKRHTLLSILQRTCTPMGARLMRRWLVYIPRSTALSEARLEAIEDLLHGDLFARLQPLLRGLGDLERVTSRIALHTARPRDLLALLGALRRLETLQTYGLTSDGLLGKLYERLAPMETLSQKLGDALSDHPPALLRDGGVFRPGYDDELDRLRDCAHHHSRILLDIETRERKKTGLSTLKVGYHRVHGYYLELSRNQAPQAPEHYQRRQTLKNVERFTLPELKTLEEELLSAESRAETRERWLYDNLLQELRGQSLPLQRRVQALAHLDVLCALADCAERFRWNRPSFSEDPVLQIEEGRHPVVETVLEEPFIPNPLHLDATQRMHIITGPNMGGKSTYMRQNALILILGRMGSFVPARQACLGNFDAIHTRIGSADDLAGGRSTFMVEMQETAAILERASPQSFVILDELGRGTSTYDGLSLAYGVIAFLQEKKIPTLFATHYFELTALADERNSVCNMHFAAREYAGRLVFLHDIQKGPAEKSYGLHVAALAGIPEEVLGIARQKLLELHQPVAPPSAPQPLARYERMIEELRLVHPELMPPIKALEYLQAFKKEYADAEHCPPS